jgi:uncharacterized damage-inducible protein DinB
MDVTGLLLDLFGRVDEEVPRVVHGLDTETLNTAIEPGTNPIGWLVWHLTRVQDDHVAEVMGEEQLWAAGEWAASFGLPADVSNTGYDHSWEDVLAVQPRSAKALLDYYEAVAARTKAWLPTLTPADLDRIVDTRWDPPVTLGVRLISVADDDIQHAGQAALVRGILERR